MKKMVFLLASIFILLVFCSFFSQTQTMDYEIKFQSTGFLYNDLYWLRDKEIKNFAEWIFCSIPKNLDDILLEINALATDISGGGWRPSAKLLMSYGEFNFSNNQVTKLENKNITLLNVSTIDDINEYWCRAIVKIPKSILNSYDSLYVKIVRLSPYDSFVAFHKDSILIKNNISAKLKPKFNRYEYWSIPTDNYPQNYASKLISKRQNNKPDIWVNPLEIKNHNLRAINKGSKEIKLTAQVHNIGQVSAKDVIIYFLVNGKVIGEKKFDSMSYGSNYIRYLYWKIPENFSENINFTVIVDPNNDIQESNEGNNRTTHQILMIKNNS